MTHTIITLLAPQDIRRPGARFDGDSPHHHITEDTERSAHGGPRL